MKNETIVDRVVERLKAQPLGDLITEEDLHEIVKQAIPKTFFERRVDVDTGRGYRETTRDREPLILEIMRELLQASAKEAVNKWLVDNADLVRDHWIKVVDAGLLKYVQQMQDEIATGHIRLVLNSILAPINQERARHGQPNIFV